MNISKSDLFRAAHWATLASAVSILLSIAASQILLGLALALLLASRGKLRLPRIWLPLSLFLLGTLISLAFSPEPMHGLPQVKKMFVFTILLVLFSTVRDLESTRNLFLAWAAVGSFVALWAVVQFAIDVQQAQAQHQNFYDYYLPRRITGAMSHWMTFAGQEMLVLLMLMAFLLFAPIAKRWWLWAGCAALLALAELLNETRTVWLGLAVGGIYLLWNWNRKVAVIAPMLAVAILWFSPGQIHERFVSIFKPKRDTDSNEFRYIMDRTGIAMIKAHPLLGIGPEEAKYHMLEWIPKDKDIPNPLPPGYYQHLHNFYLQYAAERGIPTMLMMLWMLGMILYDFSRSLNRLPSGRSLQRFLLAGGVACVLGIMLSGIFEVNLGDTEVLTAFLVVVACGYLAVTGVTAAECLPDASKAG
jgi:putative inorganic carbon (hco3(-)) transporter